jgi:hypothetical protein
VGLRSSEIEMEMLLFLIYNKSAYSAALFSESYGVWSAIRKKDVF